MNLHEKFHTILRMSSTKSLPSLFLIQKRKKKKSNQEQHTKPTHGIKSKNKTTYMGTTLVNQNETIRPTFTISQVTTYRMV